MSKTKHNILVLNKGYIPTHVVDWTKGITLLYKDHAHALDREYVAYRYEDWINFSISNLLSKLHII